MKTIEKLQQELQVLLPMKEADKQRYDQKIKLDFNYNSNHLEGNTLTYGQTELLLMFGETSGNANLKDYEEMKAHNVGLEMIKIEAQDKERLLSENFIRELNKTILVNDFQKLNADKTSTYTIHVGIYKTRPNSVITATGEKFDYALPEETSALMQILIDWYRVEEQKGELNPIELAALLHYRYIRIHPFEDGNGRIARLLVNYVLLRHGLPMLVIRTDDKENYLRILHQCDVQTGFTPSDGANAILQQIQPFVKYLKEQEIRALELMIKAAKGESLEEPDDFEKRIKLLEMQARQKIENKQFNVTQIYINFIFPLLKQIEKTLNGVVSTFYEEYWIETIIRDYNEPINLLKMNDLIENHFKNYGNINHILLSCGIKMAKDNYFMILPLNIEKGYFIEFEKDFYLFGVVEKDIYSDDKFKQLNKLNYNTYPTKDEINEIVNHFQTEILQQIETAINKSKVE
jgi:Fic family protein